MGGIKKGTIKPSTFSNPLPSLSRCSKLILVSTLLNVNGNTLTNLASQSLSCKHEHTFPMVLIFYSRVFKAITFTN